MGEILINQLFAGAYLQEGSNIGHEIINIFRDDNDDNYLFITPSGRVDNHNVDRVLFVQNIKSRETMEVIMKAEGLMTTDEDKLQHIFYAGVGLADIFSKNVHNGNDDTLGTEALATYKAAVVRAPRKGKRIIITVDPNYSGDDDCEIILIPKEKIVGQGMRTYLSSKSYPEAYDIINKALDDDSLWADENETQKMIPDETYSRSNITFLEIIRKENDELIMSNLLAYYFNCNRRMFSKFANDVLQMPNFTTSYEIIRESMKNIDLWIRDKDNIIVIENKIKSGLNGKSGGNKTQLNKYYDFTENYKKENNVDNAFYYLFMPNYSDIVIDDADIRDKYKVIYYSEIYNFFRQNAAEYLDDKYFPDFLHGLKNQTMTYPELRLSIMRSRFLEKINQR